jgi:hypothetical protein
MEDEVILSPTLPPPPPTLPNSKLFPYPQLALPEYSPITGYVK